MKALLINGSPHANGCTFTALSIVAEELQKNGIETEIIHIGNKDIRGCIACGKCAELGRCVFNDMVNEVAPKTMENETYPYYNSEVLAKFEGMQVPTTIEGLQDVIK